MTPDLETSFGDELPEIDKDWESFPVRYDPHHFLAIFLMIVATKACALFSVFATASSMCVFKPMPGEYRRVVDHVRKMRPGITNQEISKLPWRYFRRMMRFICPSPFIIMTQLRDMCEVFSKMIDPKTKKYFLVPDWPSKLQKSLRYVATGMLSDKQGL